MSKEYTISEWNLTDRWKDWLTFILAELTGLDLEIELILFLSLIFFVSPRNQTYIDSHHFVLMIRVFERKWNSKMKYWARLWNESHYLEINSRSSIESIKHREEYLERKHLNMFQTIHHHLAQFLTLIPQLFFIVFLFSFFQSLLSNTFNTISIKSLQTNLL